MRTDAELLRAYAAAGDEPAFAELVSRHGAMVYRSCLRVLGDEHDAEESAQAVFVVLARKARSLREAGSLAAWLHGVARNVSARHLRDRLQRSKREEAVAMIRTAGGRDGRAGAGAESGRAEVLADLDQEVAALPAAQRQAVILHYLEGLSHEQAAQAAGCPRGTLSRRASEGLERLRQRLCGRGHVLGSAALVGLLGAEAAAAVPAALLPSIVAVSKFAAAGAAGGAAGTGVVALAEGAMKAMFWIKVKLAAAVLVAAAAVGGGGAAAIIAAAEPTVLKAESPEPKTESAVSDQGIECRVTALPGSGKVTLSAGAEQGLRPRFELDVERDGKKVATLRITAVEPKSSTAELVSTTGELKVGDQAATRFKVLAAEKPAVKEERGKEVAGLVASLRTKKTQFAVGEPIELEVAIRNLSDREIVLSHGRSVEAWGLRFGAWSWLIPATKRVVDPEPLTIGPGEVKSVTLWAGDPKKAGYENFCFYGEMRDRSSLPPGRYVVQARHWEVEAAGGAWTGEFHTNPVEIAVGPADGDAVNGLKLSLKADRTDLRVYPRDSHKGAKIDYEDLPSFQGGGVSGDLQKTKLQLAFANVGTEPLKLDAYCLDFYRIKLILTGPDGKEVKPAILNVRITTTPPSKESYPEIAAGTGWTYPFTLDFPVAHLPYRFELSQFGEHRLKAVYTAPPVAAQHDFQRGVWTGSVISNEVVIKVLPPEGAGAAKPAAGAPDEATARRLALEFLQKEGARPRL